MNAAEEARFVTELLLLLLFGIIGVGGIVAWLRKKGRIQ